MRALSRPLTTRREKAQIATVSAHNDASIGELVADAVEEVGSEGVITVEEAKGTETALEVVEGMQFDRGYLSAYFVTDPERMECVMLDPLILVHEKKIGLMQSLLPLLEQVVKLGRPLLIVAEDVEGEALATLVLNKMRGVFACAAVKAPGYGDQRRALLEDMAILTGGQLVAEEIGLQIEHLAPGDLGKARRVVVTRETTTIIGGGGEKQAIEGRIEQIRHALTSEGSHYEKEKLRGRLTKLSGGVAVIRVGAPSEAEMKSRKEAFEDAISATKAALDEGVVPGGGLSLLRAIETVEQQEAGCDGDERTGLRILKHALEEPRPEPAMAMD